ncbi:hypothetical protein IRZ71_04105 [Flavobacterium sp. ANB]|uniref:hypothetical protein n=1 Tax=unclassified Flavobacterium TaxID=196869 RepID=UPI0012B9F0AE|nr:MULTISPECIES: hypothetical protein [unclassified Flavobacterium]MBF4515508.1 hypothetical protein [Flavobacterium sp. ANB]MTD68511.1 hypothetical protein [Flavobacterium sp. LC2016-13]
MKKLFILSVFILASGTFVSCTNDEEDGTTTTKSSLPVSADDPDTGGGQSGQTPVPPPK